MLAVPGSLPVDGRSGAGEVTFDRVRVLAAVEAERVRLSSRNNKEVTASGPQLPALAAQLGRGSGPSSTVRSRSSSVAAPTSG